MRLHRMRVSNVLPIRELVRKMYRSPEELAGLVRIRAEEMQLPVGRLPNLNKNSVSDDPVRESLRSDVTLSGASKMLLEDGAGTSSRSRGVSGV